MLNSSEMSKSSEMTFQTPGKTDAGDYISQTPEFFVATFSHLHVLKAQGSLFKNGFYLQATVILAGTLICDSRQSSMQG